MGKSFFLSSSVLLKCVEKCDSHMQTSKPAKCKTQIKDRKGCWKTKWNAIWEHFSALWQYLNSRRYAAICTYSKYLYLHARFIHSSGYFVPQWKCISSSQNNFSPLSFGGKLTNNTSIKIWIAQIYVLFLFSAAVMSDVPGLLLMFPIN